MTIANYGGIVNWYMIPPRLSTERAHLFPQGSALREQAQNTHLPAFPLEGIGLPALETAA